ncbi:hypothetical protein V8F33_002291 [Rhypophila sp. PSN 637]
MASDHGTMSMSTLENNNLPVEGGALNRGTPTSFLNLPSKLRNIIYELVIVRRKPIDWVFFDLHFKWPTRLTPGLLTPNKVIHAEARALLYGKNRWEYDLPTPDQLVSFFDKIGSTNIDYIRYFRIPFPQFHRDIVGRVTLDDGSYGMRWNLRIDDGYVGILANLQTRCTNLSTLETSFHTTAKMEDIFAKVDLKVAAEALKLGNLHFRAISCLKEILVEADEKDPSDPLRQEMKALGWTIRAPDLGDEDWVDGSSSFGVR